MSRRAILAAGGIAVAGGLAPARAAGEAAGKVYRIGVISASIEGKPQRVNGHTWQFCHPFAQRMDLDVVKKYLDVGTLRVAREFFRNPSRNFGQLPFADTRLTHVYAADATTARMFAEGYPGVEVAPSVEAMVKEVDAVWLGDASGTGDDHYDLVAPALERGLPTFCDKPIGKTVAGARAILELAKKHKAPLMSSSNGRYQWGMEEAVRLRDGGEVGTLQYVTACQAGEYSLPLWFVYGHHPVYSAMTLCGPGVEAVSMVARGQACHAMITWPDRMPAEVWYGRPDLVGQSVETTAYFAKRKYSWTPAIEGNYWMGHHYAIYKLADAFRRMIRTGVEPVPHQEILEVTAILWAGARSLEEKGRYVNLAEVMG